MVVVIGWRKRRFLDGGNIDCDDDKGDDWVDEIEQERNGR